MHGLTSVRNKPALRRSNARSVQQDTRLNEKRRLQMSTTNRRLGGVLVGIGGLGALWAIICCLAPWIFAGALVALGLGFLLKNVVVMAIAVVGLVIAFVGWRMMTKEKRHGGTS